MASGIYNEPLPPVLPPVRRTMAVLFNEFLEWTLDQQLLVILSLPLVLMYVIIHVIAFFVRFFVQELWRKKFVCLRESGSAKENGRALRSELS